MSEEQFRLAVLGKENRSGFHSGSEPLDRYFHRQVSQDVRRGITTCFIAVEIATGTIAGFYTLSAADILMTSIPEDMKKRLPRYPTVPAARLGRLAVDQRFQGMKLGSAMLFDAVQRAARSELGVHAMIVEAKDESAEAFYIYHGFTSYGSASKTLIAPLHKLLKPQS